MKNLTDLAEFLKVLPPEKFDMESSCGSVCCIGGWVQKVNRAPIEEPLSRSVSKLGPSIRQASALCYADTPDGSDIYYPAWGATPKQAARAVEILRDEGIVDWPRAMEEVPYD